MTTGKQILIVDDDTTLLQILSKQLQLPEDFITVAAKSGSEALELAKKDYFAVIILDIGLPDINGREVCRLMRRNGVTSPIIMLTNADTEAGTILDLESGANGSVTKPFRLRVLLAKLHAYIYQHERSGDAVVTIGPYIFQPNNKLLVSKEDEKKVRLTNKETAILESLYQAGTKAVNRDVLLDEVWGYNASIATHTLETHVYRLRQKIEPDPSNAEILLTEPGGYRLVP